MQKHIRFLAGTLLATCLLSPAVAQEATAPTADTVVATVDGTDITLGHMIAAYESLPADYQQLESSALYDGILEQLIQQTALAKSLGDTVSKRTAKALENEERALKANDVLRAALDEAVTEDDIKAAYDEAYGSFEPETEYNASHILLETEEDAIAVKAAIDEGADFAATAREKSTGPSGPNGGNLGWFGKGAMVPDFEAAVIALEPGQVSDPVQTQFGWHVIILNEIGETTAPTLDEERDRLTAQLQRQAVTEIVQGSTENVTVSRPADLEIDPNVLLQSDLLD